MASDTQLKGFDSFSKYSYLENLEKNLIMFFDWGFINKDAFQNFNIPTSGAYGGDYSRLRLVNDTRFSNGTIWESARLNWIWESGLESANQPISISGIFVNNIFKSKTDGTYRIDYPNGRIIFNSGIALNSTVRVAHSSKWINVIPSDSVPWLRKFQQNSFRVDNSNFLSGSGDYLNFSESRLQLPVVAVEIADDYYEPAAIGGSQYCYARVKFHVIAEDVPTVKRISNAISSQSEKTIFIFDSNRMASENRFPLDQFGSVISGAMTYPQLVAYSGVGGYRQLDGVLAGKVSLDRPQTQSLQVLTSNVIQKTTTYLTNAILTRI